MRGAALRKMHCLIGAGFECSLRACATQAAKPFQQLAHEERRAMREEHDEISGRAGFILAPTAPDDGTQSEAHQSSLVPQFRHVPPDCPGPYPSSPGGVLGGGCPQQLDEQMHCVREHPYNELAERLPGGKQKT